MGMKKEKLRRRVIGHIICLVMCIFIFDLAVCAEEMESEEVNVLADETNEDNYDKNENYENEIKETDIEFEEPKEDLLENPVQNRKQGKWYYNQKNRKWYYYDFEGTMLKDCSAVINGARYFFNVKGEMRTGWIKEPEGWYYAQDNGVMKGWVYVGKKWYYLDGNNQDYPGLMVANEKRVINGATYFFYASGEMLTGWIKKPEGWYYAQNSGAMAKGWVYIGKKWYYLDGNNQDYPGLMSANCEKEIGKIKYRFNSDGSMKTGWYLQNGRYYYYDASGAQASGWRLVGGKWYYMRPEDHVMECGGWKKINNKYYYLNNDGSMAQRWLRWYGNWYYLGTEGDMKTGWVQIGSNWYYLYKENDKHGGEWGTMAKSTTIDGYIITSDGIWNTAFQNAYNVLNRIGWDLRAAYNWSAGLRYYRMNSSPSQGSTYFANFGFSNGYGNCYVMAATFYHMAKLLGYDAHQVAGYCPLRSGGLTPHSWCEITINGTNYVFDPNFTNETGRNGYQITYGTSGTWRYTNYYRMN